MRVQPKLSGHVAMFFGTRELQTIPRKAPSNWKFAQGLLDSAGVPYTSTVLIGRSAETIAQAAREFGCDRILFGQEGRAWPARCSVCWPSRCDTCWGRAMPTR